MGVGDVEGCGGKGVLATDVVVVGDEGRPEGRSTTGVGGVADAVGEGKGGRIVDGAGAGAGSHVLGELPRRV